jgi:hypothetical protein
MERGLGRGGFTWIGQKTHWPPPSFLVAFPLMRPLCSISFRSLSVTVLVTCFKAVSLVLLPSSFINRSGSQTRREVEREKEERTHLPM